MKPEVVIKIVVSFIIEISGMFLNYFDDQKTISNNF